MQNAGRKPGLLSLAGRPLPLLMHQSIARRCCGTRALQWAEEPQDSSWLGGLLGPSAREHLAGPLAGLTSPHSVSRCIYCRCTLLLY